MINSVSKHRIARGVSYVLQTSQLQKALEDAKITCYVELHYWMPQSGTPILQGHFWLPNQNVSYPRVYISAGCVPSASRVTAAEALQKEGLPAFIRWLSTILKLPENSTAWNREPYFNAEYIEMGLVITCHPRIDDKIC